MKKSGSVPAVLCAAVGAAVLTGCSRPTSVRRCVDPVTGQVMADTMCSSPVTASSYRGGRFAKIKDVSGRDVCFDTTTNNEVAMSNCASSGYYGGGYYYGGIGRGLIRPSWGYGGTFSGGRVRGFSSSVPSDYDVKDSRGTVIRRGFGSSSSSSGSSSFS